MKEIYESNVMCIVSLKSLFTLAIKSDFSEENDDVGKREPYIHIQVCIGSWLLTTYVRIDINFILFIFLNCNTEIY